MCNFNGNVILIENSIFFEFTSHKNETLFGKFGISLAKTHWENEEKYILELLHTIFCLAENIKYACYFALILK